MKSSGTGSVSVGVSMTNAMLQEPKATVLTGVVETLRDSVSVPSARKRTTPVGASSVGYYQPRPAELPAAVTTRLAGLPRNYHRLYVSFTDASNPAIPSDGRNVRLNEGLAKRLMQQCVADKRRLTTGTRRPALVPSHYIDAALRDVPATLEDLGRMGQSFRLRTIDEALPKPNTYTVTRDVCTWIDDLKDELGLHPEFKGLLGHVINACVEAFLDGLAVEAEGQD